ncbi:chloride channel protein, partial [Candidatus Saccharibacteria bacterium]|nr:chloride channel protein [Candidatus Saccharibacteria bacterium]
MNRPALIKLFIASAVLGGLVGLLSTLFIRTIQEASQIIWTSDYLSFAQNKPWAVVVIALIGGIGMGLCVKFFGTNDEGIGFESVLVTVEKDGELGVKQLKRVVINAYLGLISGASIGPESPLVTIGGICGNYLARLLKTTKEQLMAFITVALGGSMGILLDSPVAGPILFAERPPTKNPDTNRVLVFASMVAASMGFGIYYLLGSPLLKGKELVPAYGNFRLVHLLYGLLIGVVGTAIGIFLKFLIFRFRSISREKIKWPIVRGALVGLIIGILGAIWPLVLFDGSAQLSHLVANVSHYSIVMLLTLALVRLITTSVALGGGYQGGNVFPSIFIAGATGLAISALF